MREPLLSAIQVHLFDLQLAAGTTPPSPHWIARKGRAPLWRSAQRLGRIRKYPTNAKYILRLRTPNELQLHADNTACIVNPVSVGSRARTIHDDRHAVGRSCIAELLAESHANKAGRVVVPHGLRQWGCIMRSTSRENAARCSSCSATADLWHPGNFGSSSRE